MMWATLPGVDLGYLPSFLDESDPRSAREQINANYIGGWMEMKGMSMDSHGSLLYPGDPPLFPIAVAVMRNEKIMLYVGDWVAIVQEDGTFEVARIS
jgi:hypothetical protein